jgi:hypothetical protein
MRRTEEEPNLWPRLRPRPRPSLWGEVLASLCGGTTALAALWFFFAPSPAVSEVIAPTDVPVLASTEHREMAQWLARGE